MSGYGVISEAPMDALAAGNGAAVQMIDTLAARPS
jgi:hypothetical protein